MNGNCVNKIVNINFYIYKTTNLINGKIYIGKRSTNLSIDKDPYLGSGKILKDAIKKNGKSSFKKEILEVCSKQILDEREIYWIDLFDARNLDIGYNIVEGGTGGSTFKGRKHSEETKKKMSEIRKGIKFSEQHILNLSVSHKGGKGNPNKQSEESKRKISEAVKRHISKNGNVVLSVEARKKISDSKKGKKRDPETIKKISETRKKNALSKMQ